MSEANCSRGGRNVFLDLFKLVLSFMVICIHLSGEDYAFYPLYRIAVPAFFMISGYFLASSDRETEKRRASAFVGRSAKYMLAGIAFYTVYELISCISSGTSIGWFFTTLFYEGNDVFFRFFIQNAPIPYYTVGAQLWFLIALFVSSLVHALLARIGKTDYYKIIVPIAFAAYFFFGGFMYFIQPQTALPIRYIRNAWFFGLPNLGLGYLAARVNRGGSARRKWAYLAAALVLFFLQIPEASLYPENAELEMYISGVAAALLFILFFMEIKAPLGKLYYRFAGKSASFCIYILHMGVAVEFERLCDFSSSMLKCVAVFFISFAIYEIVFLFSRLLSHVATTRQGLSEGR